MKETYDKGKTKFESSTNKKSRFKNVYVFNLLNQIKFIKISLNINARQTSA